ncbi:MAG TPA: hypothetical protein VF837_05020 [Patescibacteria group bacterium]
MKFITYLSIFLFVSIAFLSFNDPALAAKKRAWNKASSSSSLYSPFSVSAKFTGWKQYLNLSFRGLGNTKGVSYNVIYSSNGIDQALGGINANEKSTSRSVFLGTCSHGACTAHKNISNMRLMITYQTLDGQNITKNYKVRY